MRGADTDRTTRTRATPFGFGFSDHTGFANNIDYGYANDGTQRTYVCGTNYMPNAPILHNTPEG